MIDTVNLNDAVPPADVARLDNVEQKVGNFVEAATARSITADIWLRIVMVLVVCAIFIWLNWQVMDFVKQALRTDIESMAATPPMPAGDRLITSSVVMSLIGATVVQTGIGFIAITSYLFPKRASQSA